LTALLDTHVLLWWVGGNKRLSRAQKRVIESASAERPLLVAQISQWEIATLVSLGRINLDRPLRDWLEAAMAAPLVQTVGITPAVAAEVASLPSTFHGDPANRLIVATARVMGATLLTADQRIVDAASCRRSGHANEGAFHWVIALSRGYFRW